MLIYHDVVPRAERRSSGFDLPGADHYKLSPELFAAHLDALAGCDVLLTFDDGGASALTAIAPALERRELTGVFFVTTGRLGTPGFLDAQGLRELRARGHAIGSHTHTHPDLTRFTEAESAREWRRSKDVLEEALGEAVTTASVPGGFYSTTVARIAFGQGYADLYTSEPWLRPRRIEGGLVHGRFSVVENTPAGKVAALGRRDRGTILRDQASWQARRLAKRGLGPVYRRIRERVLDR